MAVVWQTCPHAIPPSRQEEGAERERREELAAVFCESLVAALHNAELALNDAEGVLDLGADDGDDAVGLRIDGMPFAALWCLPHDTPGLARTVERRLALGADIALVGLGRRFLAVQQFVPYLTVMKLGSRGLEPVSNAAAGIRADVRLYSETPVFALLR